MKLIDLSVNQVHANPVQPNSRTSAPALVGLQEAFRRSGLIVPPVVMRNGNGFVAVDGHRRWQTAVAEGERRVQCLLIDERDTTLSPEELFNLLNGPTRKMSGREWFESWANATHPDQHIKSIPKNTASMIREFIRVFGAEESRNYAKAGTCPSVVRSIARCLRFVRQYGEPISAKQAGRWIIKHRAQVTVRVLDTTGGKREADRLRRKIVADEAYSLRRRTPRAAA